MKEIAYDIFISFKNSDEKGNHTEDRALANRLYEFLKSKNLKVFFSESTLQELGADSWGNEIENALRVSKIFIALSTKEEYFYSYWLQRERTTFLTLKRDDKSKALYSYIASPLSTNNLPEDIKGLECFEDSKANEFKRLYEFISSHLFRYFHRLKEGDYLNEETANPYKGLQSFDYEDRENYYGRKDEAKKIVQKVKNSRFFTLLGASGSGKSSFLFAGIKPLLEQEGVEIVDFRPLDNPFLKLVSAFMPFLFNEKLEQLKKENEFKNELIKGKISINQLISMSQKEGKIQKLYIIIDQFEELFTLTKEKKKREAFLDTLLSIINSKLEVTLILSMRSDFLSHFSNYAPFNQAFNDENNPKHLLGLFDKERLREVIEEPSKKIGVSFENGLIDKIIDEIDLDEESGQLPLLEFALYQLWNEKKGRVISFDSLNEIGGINQSISKYADEVYEKHNKKENSIKRVFINLVTIGRGTEDTKKRAKLKEFKEEDRETITLLSNERLIVTYKDKNTNENEIEIVHEALIREWKQLKGWIDEYRVFCNGKRGFRLIGLFMKRKGIY